MRKIHAHLDTIEEPSGWVVAPLSGHLVFTHNKQDAGTFEDVDAEHLRRRLIHEGYRVTMEYDDAK